jgi:hypothetical protein
MDLAEQAGRVLGGDSNRSALHEQTAPDWAKIGARNNVANAVGNLNWAVHPMSVFWTRQAAPHDLCCSGTLLPVVMLCHKVALPRSQAQRRSAGPDPGGSATLLSFNTKSLTGDRVQLTVQRDSKSQVLARQLQALVV